MLHGIWFYNCTNLTRYRCAAWDLVLYLYKFSKIQVCCMGFGSIIVQIKQDTGVLHGIWFYNCTNLARYRCAAGNFLIYLFKFSTFVTK